WRLRMGEDGRVDLVDFAVGVAQRHDPLAVNRRKRALRLALDPLHLWRAPHGPERVVADPLARLARILAVELAHLADLEACRDLTVVVVEAQHQRGPVER